MGMSFSDDGFFGIVSIPKRSQNCIIIPNECKPGVHESRISSIESRGGSYFDLNGDSSKVKGGSSSGVYILSTIIVAGKCKNTNNN